MALDPVLFNVFVVLASLLIIFKAADLVVYGISRYARKLGLSDILIGLVVVALAASMPEIISSLTGLMIGREEVLFGTILGTNLVHLALVLGVLALVGKRIRLESEFLGPSIWVLWLALLAPFALMLWDNELGRVDGVILIALYVMYLGWLWHREESSGHLKKRVLLRTIWRDALIFVLSLVAILLAGRWLVFGSINLAALAGIPAYFIALTVLALGGALPDFAVGLRSIMRGHQDVGVGDVLGSVALEFLFFFGLIGLLNPLAIDAGQIINAVVFLAVALTLVIFFVQRRTMTWKHGALLIGLYAVFLAIEIAKLVS
ncbi:sodium:calcium antiporter [Candidatus Woesearchaeota archaeon]|nr:sodium:calcium antiporter [Candidatus Woesearchaeota archaeon]